MPHNEVRGHAPQVSLDGRISYPSIAVYIWWYKDSGYCIFNHPPKVAAFRDSNNPVVKYTIEVRDLVAYDELGRTGFWFSEAHTGISSGVVDGRPAPGA